MKQLTLIFSLFILFLNVNSNKANDYNNYFTKKRIRFNYKVEGNAWNTTISPVSIIKEKIWGGSQVNLLDTFMYGVCFFEIIDNESNKVIYSRGFSDLFSEWQTTAEAKVTTRTYTQSLIFPAPIKNVQLKIYKRDTLLNFSEIYSVEINPNSEKILDAVKRPTYNKYLHRGNRHSKALDIVLIAEGYRQTEKNKFLSDARRFANYLFKYKPYNKYKDNINLNAVFAASEESGVDNPGMNMMSNSILDAHFNTFGIDRYLTLPDLSKVYDFLTEYPVDQVVIIANSSKYGGGGMYNFYNIFTSDNAFASYLFLHEFGHGFAGLADEYFNSKVAYEEFGNLNIEPSEPNITTLANFDKKWKNLLHDTVPVPTPDISLYDNVLGVFEGANYNPTGYYRPYRNCMMRGSVTNFFCPVCARSIEQMIKFYSK